MDASSTRLKNHRVYRDDKPNGDFVVEVKEKIEGKWIEVEVFIFTDSNVRDCFYNAVVRALVVVLEINPNYSWRKDKYPLPPNLSTKQ